MGLKAMRTSSIQQTTLFYGLDGKAKLISLTQKRNLLEFERMPTRFRVQGSG